MRAWTGMAWRTGRTATGLMAVLLALAGGGCITVTVEKDEPPAAAPLAATSTAEVTATLTPWPSPTPPPRPAAASSAESAARIIVPRPAAGRTVSLRPPALRLAVPRIGLDTRVIELQVKADEHGNAVWETPAFAAGHHRGAAQPGEQGNIVVSGHVSSRTEGAVFQRLPELRSGDGVVLSTADRDYLYRVTGVNVVEPSAIEVMGATDDERLTLITCVPDGIYTHRLVVTAQRAR